MAATATTACRVCHEQIRRVGRVWTHLHSGDVECWTGDGATAYPEALEITRVEDAGWAGWRWITFASGDRKSVTLREVQARTDNGEWYLPETVWPFVGSSE